MLGLPMRRVVKVASNTKLHAKIFVDGAGMTPCRYTADYKQVSGCVDDSVHVLYTSADAKRLGLP